MTRTTTHTNRSRGMMLGTASITAMIVLSASSASAQTSAPPPASAAPPAVTNVDDIVVTANRRSETVQKANQSISAISGEQLQAQGVTSVAQIAAQIPGIAQKDSGPGQTQYEIRGVSSAGGTSPTVGFYLDDVSLTAPASGEFGKVVIDPNLYDLNRIEVLRGPQGTLYGSSSMGGTVRLITNQPNTQAFAASVQATGSGTNGGGANGSVSAMVNIPIVQDKLALRIVGTDSYTDGWIDRIVENNFPLPTNNGTTRGDVLAATPSAEHHNSNWEHLYGARASLLWQPSEDFTVSPTVFYQKTTMGAPNYVDVPPGPKYEAHYQPFDVSEPYSDQFTLYTLPIKYKFSNVQFDSITAYYKRNSSAVIDNSEILQNEVNPATFAQAGPIASYETDKTTQFTQEIRLSSLGDGPFQWLAGLYYQDYKSATVIGATPANAYITNNLFGGGTDAWFYEYAGTHLKQYAAFGEASYKLGDLKLTGGLRYYSYRTVSNVNLYGFFFTGTGPSGAIVATYPTASAHGLIPRVNLSYTPNKDLTLYAQAAKGFRPGAENPPSPVGCPSTPSQYGPDSVWSYEAGGKARFFDQRLTINAAAYDVEWTRIQQVIDIPSCGYAYTGNAGSARLYGAEMEVSLKLTPELSLSTGLGYTHARLTSVLPGTGFNVGDLVQAVPKWTDTTSLVYTHSLNDDLKLTFRATDVYVDSQTDPAYVVETIPAHNFVNLRLGLLDTKRRLSVSLFANNVTDKRTVTANGNPLSFYIPSVNLAVTNQPRTIGVELNYAFGGR